MTSSNAMSSLESVMALIDPDISNFAKLQLSGFHFFNFQWGCNVSVGNQSGENIETTDTACLLPEAPLAATLVRAKLRSGVHKIFETGAIGKQFLPERETIDFILKVAEFLNKCLNQLSEQWMLLKQHQWKRKKRRSAR